MTKTRRIRIRKWCLAKPTASEWFVRVSYYSALSDETKREGFFATEGLALQFLDSLQITKDPAVRRVELIEVALSKWRSTSE